MLGKREVDGLLHHLNNIGGWVSPLLWYQENKEATHVKREVCLYDHARCITQQEKKPRESEEPPWETIFATSSVLSLTQRVYDREREERPLTVHAPFVAGISESIRRVYNDFNIRAAVFRSGPTLCSFLTIFLYCNQAPSSSKEEQFWSQQFWHTNQHYQVRVHKQHRCGHTP